MPSANICKSLPASEREGRIRERKADILALLAGVGGGGRVGANSKPWAWNFFNTVSTLSVHNMEVLTVFVVSTVTMHVQ